MNLHNPFTYALIAAVGNAIFAAGQKKALVLANPFAFNTLMLFFCLMETWLVSLFFGKLEFALNLKANSGWAALCGFGIVLTFLGMNLLYTNFGASSYTLYAIVSMLTTSVILGVLIFQEQINIWHWLSILCGIGSIFLFYLGNKAGT